MNTRCQEKHLPLFDSNITHLCWRLHDQDSISPPTITIIKWSNNNSFPCSTCIQYPTRKPWWNAHLIESQSASRHSACDSKPSARKPAPKAWTWNWYVNANWIQLGDKIYEIWWDLHLHCTTNILAFTTYGQKHLPGTASSSKLFNYGHVTRFGWPSEARAKFHLVLSGCHSAPSPNWSLWL